MTTRITDKNITSTGVAAGTYTNATVAVNAQGQITSASSGSSGSGGPKITTITVTDSSYNNLDDTAVDIAGGYIKIAGSGFANGCLVYLNQTPANSVSFVSSSELRVSVPALAAGTYIVYVINTDGGVAISVPGVTFSASPAWQTASALSDQYDNTAITLNLVAADATSYTLTSGSLPPGLTLNTSTGAITGTVTTVTVDTSYTFTVRATDAQLQDSPRTFTVTITVSDAYFKLTTLLLGSEQGNTVIKDSSTNNFNLTAFGDTRASNFTPYSTGWSNSFNGSSALTLPSTSSLAFGTGDFCVEFWVYKTTSASAVGVFSNSASSGGGDAQFEIQINASLKIILIGWNTTFMTGATSINSNVWYHVAVVRSGTAMAIFVNGTRDATATSANNFSSTNAFNIARQATGSSYLPGYISNLRAVKGSSVYNPASTTITVPTSPLTNIINTSLLACQWNRFIDNGIANSGSGFAITTVGTPSVVPFNPFNITNTGDLGSAYFGGGGNYVQANGANFAVGTGDFTFECWVYTWVFSGDPGIMQIGPSAFATNTPAYTNSIGMSVTVGGNIFFYNNGTYTTGNQSIQAYSWAHLAVCRSGTTHRLFVNGVQAASVTDSSNYTGQFFGAGLGYGTNFPFTGYISNVRLLRGTALYTANFTPPTNPLTAVTNTQLLTLQYRQPHNNHGFQDSSVNQFLITRNGNASQGTFSPFSQTGWSNYFAGATNNSITVATGSGYAFGTGDFCKEFFCYANSYPANWRIISAQTSSVVNILQSSGAILGVDIAGGGITSTGFTLPTTTWFHIVVTRQSNTIRIFIDGVLRYNVSNSTNFATSQNVHIGGFPTFTQSWDGYISNARIIKGSVPANYQTSSTTNGTTIFTPPTSPLTAVTGTELLTCQSNRFSDSNTQVTAKTITVTGSPSVAAFSPFAPTAVYNPTTHGGSAYFDGSGDYLWCLNNVVKQFEPSPSFTFEVWYYDDSTSTAGPAIFEIGGTTLNWNASTGLHIQLNTNYLGNQYFQWSKGDGTTTTYSWTAPSSYQWNHFAACYNGTTTSGWLNGTRVFTSTTGWPVPNYDRFSVGGNNVTPGSYFKGYVSNLRWVSGTALYNVANTSIIVPTAPLTSLSNTKLLLNFTDAAILDSTGRNVIETSGDAKVTTVQTKFGTSSQFYNGSNTNLVVPVQPYFSFPGTTSFTVEAWVYFNDLNTQLRPLIALGDGANGLGPIYNAWSMQYWGTEGSNQIGWGRYDGTSYNYLTSGLILVANTWYHIAVSRDSTNTLRIFVNGVSYYSATVTQTFAQINSNPLRIGLAYNGPASGYGGPRYFNGYIDDLRITQFARYTANFTPPTASHRLK